MELQHVNVKIYVDGELSVDPGRFIECFHGWVRDQIMEEEMLIDVADYRHVPAGPGVVLIGLEADYGMDQTGNRYGLRYNRKAPLDSSNRDRLLHALSRAARACRMLETEFGGDGLKFRRDELELFINDRAFAPNTPETYAACKPEFESFLQEILGHGNFSLQQESEPRRRFGVTVKTEQPFDLEAILSAAR